jgi:hypothetical protein
MLRVRKNHLIRVTACLIAIAGLLTYIASQYRRVFVEITSFPSAGPILLPYVAGVGSLVVLGVFLFTLVKLCREWRRKPPGLCEKCGYDLTGNVSGVCPECGRSVAESHRAGHPLQSGGRAG